MNDSSLKAMVTMLLAAWLALMGCAAPGRAAAAGSDDRSLPAWVLSPQDAYPPIRYITAVGTGRTLNEAERDAHDKLSRRFRVLLDARETHRDAYQETIGSTRLDSDWERSTSLLSTVRLSTTEQLLNAQILERFHGPDGRYYALGALERLPTARLYAEQMRVSAEVAEAHYQAAKSAPATQTLKRLAHLRAAERAARNYRALAHIHDVLSGMGGRDLLPGSQGPDLAAITAAYDELQHSITVRLVAGPDIPSGLRVELQRAVNEMGLTLMRGGETDLTLELRYDVSLRTIPRYSMVRADWRLTLGISDRADRQVATITYAERDGGSDREGALIEAERRAARTIAGRLPGDLLKTLYNESVE